MHKSCKVKELHLDSINIKDVQVSTIADGLIANKALKKLTLSGNDPITALGWHMFFRHLGKAEGLDLDFLDISNNNIDDLGISDLGRVINCCKPKFLDLSYNESITPGCWARLALMLSQSSTLTTMKEIKLSGNTIDNEGISVLGNMIKNNTSLTKLTLGSVENVTGFFGWTPFLLDLCSPNSALVDLSLYSNEINSDGLAVLARWVANNSKLKYLDLSSNIEVTPGGWHTFFVTLRNHNLVLETLDISNNVINSQAIASLVESLGNNLKSLDLSSNIVPMGIEDIRALSNLLRSPNCSLMKLNLCWNEIKDDGVILFADALANNNSLHELRLATYDPFDHVRETGWSALANVLCDRTSIDTAYTSNHTLHEVLKDEEDEGNDMNVIPDDLVELLEINEIYTKSEAARVKIIKYILVKDDGDIAVAVFVGMELNEIPSAMSWMGKEKDDI